MILDNNNEVLTDSWSVFVLHTLPHPSGGLTKGRPMSILLFQF